MQNGYETVFDYIKTRDYGKIISAASHGLTAFGQISVGAGLAAAPDPSMLTKVAAGYCFVNAASHATQSITKIINALTEGTSLETNRSETGFMEAGWKAVAGDMTGGLIYTSLDTVINIGGTYKGAKEIGNFIRSGFSRTNPIYQVDNIKYGILTLEGGVEVMGMLTVPGLFNDIKGYKNLYKQIK